MSRHDSRSHGHRFSAEGDFIERLEGPERRALIPREDILPRMCLKRNDIFIDMGSGIGYFSIPISEMVKQVIAVDLEPRMHEILRDRISKGSHRNIDAITAEITRLPVAESAVDHILAAFVYHEVDSPRELMAESSRVLKPGGTLTVIDFQKSDTSIGPPVAERKTPEQVLRSAPKALAPSERYETETYYQLEFCKR
jgi:ubiquinone/menaquinone biosynthesis C-methylase UbiE